MDLKSLLFILLVVFASLSCCEDIPVSQLTLRHAPSSLTLTWRAPVVDVLYSGECAPFNGTTVRSYSVVADPIFPQDNLTQVLVSVPPDTLTYTFTDSDIQPDKRYAFLVNPVFNGPLSGEPHAKVSHLSLACPPFHQPGIIDCGLGSVATVTDGPGRYTALEVCAWALSCEQTVDNARLTFSQLSIESGDAYLIVETPSESRLFHGGYLPRPRTIDLTSIHNSGSDKVLFKLAAGADGPAGRDELRQGFTAHLEFNRPHPQTPVVRITVSNSTHGSSYVVNITWTGEVREGIDGPALYLVERSPKPLFTQNVVRILDHKQITHVIDTLSPCMFDTGDYISYRIFATTARGESIPSVHTFRLGDYEGDSVRNLREVHVESRGATVAWSVSSHDSNAHPIIGFVVKAAKTDTGDSIRMRAPASARNVTFDVLESDANYNITIAVVTPLGDNPFALSTTVHTRAPGPSIHYLKTSYTVRDTWKIEWAPPSNSTVEGYLLEISESPLFPVSSTRSWTFDETTMSYEAGGFLLSLTYYVRVFPRIADLGLGEPVTTDFLNIGACPPDTMITARSGMLSTGPFGYKAHDRCVWTFDIPELSRLRIEILEFETEEFSDRLWLKIVNRQSLEETDLEYFHGQVDAGTTRSYAVDSATEYFQLSLDTDGSSNHPGFKLTYQADRLSPTAPINTQAVSRVPEVFLSWQPPFDTSNAPVLGYEIELSPTSDFSNHVQRSQIPGILNTTTGPVQPGQLFYCRVRANSRFGSGVWSNIRILPPGDSVFLDRPITSVINVTSSEFTVKWEPIVDPPYNQYPVTEYYVQVAKYSTSETVLTEKYSPRNTSMTASVRGLVGATCYATLVSAANALGMRDVKFSDMIVTCTADPVRPSSPRALKVPAVGYDTVFVSWEEPLSTGGASVTTYSVYRCQELGAMPVDCDPNPSNTSATSLTLKNLDTSDPFYIAVAAVNVAGESSLEFGELSPIVMYRPDLSYLPTKPCVQTGVGFTCSLFDNDRLVCHGTNLAGQLGFNEHIPAHFGADIRDYDVMPFVPLDGPVIAFSTGRRTVCAIVENGTDSGVGDFRCWGANPNSIARASSLLDSVGQQAFDISTIKHNLAPMAVRPGLDMKHTCGKDNVVCENPVSQIYCRTSTNACSVDSQGRAWCWGYAPYGNLGYFPSYTRPIGEDDFDSFVYVRFPEDGDHRIKSIAGSFQWRCFLFENGKVKCLGTGAAVGQNTQEPVLDPRTVPYVRFGNDETPITSISGSENHVCALFSNGKIKCWGLNVHGACGMPQDMFSQFIGDFPGEMDRLEYIPFNASHANDKAIQVVASADFTCALFERASGPAPTGVKCWGMNVYGVLGVPYTSPYNIREIGKLPGEMEKVRYIDFGTNSRVLQITASTEHACAVFANGKMKCLGSNPRGAHGTVVPGSIGYPLASIVQTSTTTPPHLAPFAEYRFVDTELACVKDVPRCDPRSGGDFEQCVQCRPGSRYFASTKSCVPCPSGTYNDRPNSDTCHPCPPGQTSKLQSTSNSSCFDCPAGTYSSPSSNHICELCPIGSFGVASGLGECMPCEVGTFGIKTGATSEREGCESCPLSTTTSGPGASSIDQCNVCPQNAIVASRGSACECMVGYTPGVLDAARFTCVKCPLSSFKNSTGNVRCEECGGHSEVPPALWPGTSPEACRCDHIPHSVLVGTWPDQQCICEAGYTWDPIQEQCVLCVSGYKPGAGNHPCTACPLFSVTYPNAVPVSPDVCDCSQNAVVDPLDSTRCVCRPSFGWDEQLKACIACDEDSYKPSIGNSPCKPCELGASRSGSSVHCECRWPFVTARDNSTSESSCVCDIGYEPDITSGGITRCRPCPSQAFKDTAGNERCDLCPAGALIPDRLRPGRDKASCECSNFRELSTDNTTCLCAPGYGIADPSDIGSTSASCLPCPDSAFQSLPGNTLCQPCQEGAISNANRTSCVCRDGMYLDAQFQCSSCPDGGTCAQGLSLPQPGFWRDLKSADVFYECYPELVCRGAIQGSNLTSASSICIEGHHGFMCASCSTGFARSSSGQCVPCSSMNHGILWGVYAPAVVAVSVYLYWSSGRPKQAKITIAVNYLQTLAQIGLTEDSAITTLFSLVQLDLGAVATSTCVVPGSTFTSIWLTRLASPLVYSLLVVIVWLCTRLFRKHKGSGTQDQLLRGIIQVLIWTYFSNAKSALLIFSCRQISGRRVLATNPSMTCWEGDHMVLVAIGAAHLVVFSLAFPLLLWSMLLRPQWLPQFLLRVDINALKTSYTPRNHWWEMVYMLRRICLIIAIVLLYSRESLRAFALVSLTFEALIYHVYRSPFILGYDNRLETACLHLLVLGFLAEFMVLQIASDVARVVEYAFLVLSGFMIVVMVVAVVVNALRSGDRPMLERANTNTHSPVPTS